MDADEEYEDMAEVELPPDMVEALRVYTVERERVKYHAKQADKARDTLIAFLRDNNVVFGLVDHEPRVKLTVAVRRGIDIARFTAERPALFAQYRKDNTATSLTLVGKHRGARDDG
jgi:hypothetical protein